MFLLHITVLLPVGVIKDNNNTNISRTTIRHRQPRLKVRSHQRPYNYMATRVDASGVNEPLLSSLLSAGQN